MSPPDIAARNAARLELAARCIAEGNFAAANVLCWNVLDGQPESAVAWNLLGIVAIKLGLRDNALEFFGKARDYGLVEAQANLRHAADDAAAWQSPSRASDRFLLIKAWGAGFWSDVGHVLGGLILAEVTGRIPVVHWGRNSWFGDGTDRDAYRYFFEPPSSLSIGDLMQLEGADFFPRKWHARNLIEEDNAKWAGEGAMLDAIYFLNRPEQVVVADYYISVANFAPLLPPQHFLAQFSVSDLYRYAMQKYFRPQQHIIAEAKSFFEAKLSGIPFVATHIRGSDKFVESTFTTDIDVFLSYTTGETYKILDQIDPSYRIFLMTDDERIARMTRNRYGERVIMTESQRTATEQGIHFHRDVDHPRLGVEVMIDVLLALQAPAFVGLGGSNVAAMVELLRDWPPGRCVLIGPSILRRRAQMSYLDKRYASLERPD